MFAGLYPPDSGEITLDGVRINDHTRDTYRALMSAIFFDNHLFRRLYGIPEPEPGEVDRLLTQFRLADKTSLSDGEFSTLDLSGGQRRRLALIVSLLEKRPILMLDEWTAEQDPEFRRKFYDELLPQMKQAGLTVVVITHDDRYLDELELPARRIRMDEGRICRAAFDGERLMVNYSEFLNDEPPPPKKRGWWRFVARHLPGLSVVLMVTDAHRHRTLSVRGDYGSERTGRCPLEAVQRF